MSLHLHSAACEAYLTEPPEYDDPLDAVDFPRERKPWKRDRHEFRRLAMLASQQRGPWVRDDRGWHRNLDHAQRFAELSLAAHYRYRLRVLGNLMPEREKAETKRYWRCALNEAAKRRVPPLPSPTPSNDTLQGRGEVEESPYIAGPIWAEAEDDCFTAEVQIVGGHEVVATVHGGTRDEAEHRQLAVIAALQKDTRHDG